MEMYTTSFEVKFPLEVWNFDVPEKKCDSLECKEPPVQFFVFHEPQINRTRGKCLCRRHAEEFFSNLNRSCIDAGIPIAFEIGKGVKNNGST
jgi:hypothetical protein